MGNVGEKVKRSEGRQCFYQDNWVGEGSSTHRGVASALPFQAIAAHRQSSSFKSNQIQIPIQFGYSIFKSDYHQNSR